MTTLAIITLIWAVTLAAVLVINHAVTVNRRRTDRARIVNLTRYMNQIPPKPW